MQHTWFVFIESDAFSKRVDSIGNRNLVWAIQQDLVEDPERWPLVSGTKGLRKGRAADWGKGKSGSFRYLYLYLKNRGHLHLLYLFGKDEQSELSPDQKRKLAGWVVQIRSELSESKKKQ